ncbi:MAG: hypothetical protein KAV87_23150 [Desulfobacteraceae bacterium]|nr:hypothetical protein [Desulfobacteraceae bacterium]
MKANAIGDWLCDGKRHYGDGLYEKAETASIKQIEEDIQGKLRLYKELDMVRKKEAFVKSMVLEHSMR